MVARKSLELLKPGEDKMTSDACFLQRKIGIVEKRIAFLNIKLLELKSEPEECNLYHSLYIKKQRLLKKWKKR